MAGEIITNAGDPSGGERLVTIESTVLADLALKANATGWATYQDTQYTSAAPFSVSSNTDTVLPNNAGTVIDSQMPDDVVEMYDGTKITGRNGDGLAITLEFVVRPTAGSATYIETWIEIGGSIGQIFRIGSGFAKGAGTENHITQSTVGYTLGTFEANGGTPTIRANGAVEIYDIKLTLTRTHKAK